MVNSISSQQINPIQFYRATNAFKTNPIKEQEAVQKNFVPETTDGIDVKENIITNKINVNEIMDFAKSIGEEDFSTEDIKYGLKYGRSVLADYLV